MVFGTPVAWTTEASRISSPAVTCSEPSRLCECALVDSGPPLGRAKMLGSCACPRPAPQHQGLWWHACGVRQSCAMAATPVLCPAWPSNEIGKPRASYRGMKGPRWDGTLRIETSRLDLPAELIAEISRQRRAKAGCFCRPRSRRAEQDCPGLPELASSILGGGTRATGVFGRP